MTQAASLYDYLGYAIFGATIGYRLWGVVWRLLFANSGIKSALVAGQPSLTLVPVFNRCLRMVLECWLLDLLWVCTGAFRRLPG